MTEIVPKGTPSSALDEFRAAMGPDAIIPGLEDVKPGDLALPVINIDHKKGAFVDKLTGQEWKELDVVLLGLLKQRVMWPDKPAAPGQTPKPMCKSQDGDLGHPTEDFPWETFKSNDGPEPVGAESVACETCYFAKWGSNPKNDTPWCTLQHVYPVIVGGGDNVTALLTIQRTGIKPSNGYLSGFVREGIPMFVTRTIIGLDLNRSGTVEYAVPRFRRGEPTPQDVQLWKRWAESFQKLRAMVQGADVGRSDSVVKTAEASPAADAAPILEGEVVSDDDTKTPW